jgi:ATP-dependent Clp protease ATP-binding subunit ClpA
MIEEFSDRSKHIFKLAHDLAIKQNHTLIAHHILYALIENSDQYIINILRNIGPNISILKKKNKKIFISIKNRKIIQSKC